jgi:hypothetical protein
MFEYTFCVQIVEKDKKKIVDNMGGLIKMNQLPPFKCNPH